MQLFILSGLSGSSNVIRCIRKWNIPLTIVLGDVDNVAPFIIVNEQSESNQDCSFHSSIASLLPEDHITRSYYKNLLMMLRLSFQPFNKDAVLQQFELPPEDKLLTILPKSFPFYWHEKLEEQLGKLSYDQDDARSTGSELEQSGVDQYKALSAFGIPLSSHTVLDGCIVISDSTVYECRPR